jgi:hypothetical protein
MPNNEICLSQLKRTYDPVFWVKMTVGCFRWLDVFEVYRDAGHDPAPLLLVRDVRAVYNSLVTKCYGFNGMNANDPPLRTRFRRFLQDWQLFVEQGWPIVKYEDLITDERKTLTGLCERLSLPWDEWMLEWPKKKSAILSPFTGNDSFHSWCDGNFADVKKTEKLVLNTDNVPKCELDWLNDTFADYNRHHGYPS